MSLAPAGLRPRNSIAVLIVLAVNWPPHAPAPGHADASTAASSASSMVPAACAPTASNTSWRVMSWPCNRPAAMVPLYITSPGMSRRHSAIAAAGMVLSQPTMRTRPSNEWPRATSSMESAITSRDTSDARIPSVPIDTPSLTAMVLNSMGSAPASRIPALTCSARARWLKLQGMVSIHAWPTPMIGLARSSAVKPMARSIARAGARSGPSVIAALCRLPRRGVLASMRRECSQGSEVAGRSPLAAARGDLLGSRHATDGAFLF